MELKKTRGIALVFSFRCIAARRESSLLLVVHAIDTAGRVI